MPRSVNASSWRRRSTHAPISGRARWPAMKGRNSSSTILPSAPRFSGIPSCEVSKTVTSNGVRKTPSRFDIDALQTAAATLPRAIEVNAIDDCTVEGRAHRKRIPTINSGVSSQLGDSHSMPSPSSGNATKVQASTSRCRRQWVRPAMIASRGRRAPCRKNSHAIATIENQSKAIATSPRHGRMMATTTVAIRLRVVQSISAERRCIAELKWGADRARAVGYFARIRRAMLRRYWTGLPGCANRYYMPALAGET